LCPEEAGIGGKSLEVFVYSSLQGTSQSDEQNKHEKPPKYSKARKKTPKLVSLDGNPYLLPVI